MSSIYRKGRDGYYYYQAYVINPETGKKDKRIFHSLGTTDENEAKKKQEEYDSKYEENVKNKIQTNHIPSINYKTISIIALTVIITLTLSELFAPKVKKNNSMIQNTSSNRNLEKFNNGKTNLPDDVVITNLENNYNQEIIDTNLIQPNIQKPKKIEKVKLEMPEYKIVRVDMLSEVFDQAKIFVTINKNGTSDALKLLCQNISEEYSEYTNIVICLYLDTVTGRSLALGNQNNIDIVEKQKVWLAMYTYNPVEGIYFNDSPSSYLGAFN